MTTVSSGDCGLVNLRTCCTPDSVAGFGVAAVAPLACWTPGSGSCIEVTVDDVASLSWAREEKWYLSEWVGTMDPTRQPSFRRRKNSMGILGCLSYLKAASKPAAPASSSVTASRTSTIHVTSECENRSTSWLSGTCRRSLCQVGVGKPWLAPGGSSEETFEALGGWCLRCVDKMCWEVCLDCTAKEVSCLGLGHGEVGMS